MAGANRRFRAAQAGGQRSPVAPSPAAQDEGLGVDIDPRESNSTAEIAAGKSKTSPTIDRVAPVRSAKARVRRLADVSALQVDWLWPGRLPAGMVSILDGEPAAGKSTMMLDIIARITTGRPLPGDDLRPAPADVVLIGQEDSPEHTVRPRLDAAGADVNRVHLLEDIGGRMPRLPDDAAEIERVVSSTGARLLVIDPVSAYIGQADMHRDNEVRAALAPLATLAVRTGAAVLLIRHHRKSGGVNALGRGLGSIGIMALSRTGLMLASDPDDPKARILAWSKMSVGPLPMSLRWRWIPGLAQPRIEWLGTSDLTADQILVQHERALRGGGDGPKNAVDNAAAWLMQQFENAETVPAAEIESRAMIDGVSWRTVERAKSRLGIRARRENLPSQHGRGRWVWAASPLGRMGAVPSGTSTVKTAKLDSLTALAEQTADFPPNTAQDAELCVRPKTANPNAAKREMAALDALADALADGPAHL